MGMVVQWAVLTDGTETWFETIELTANTTVHRVL